MQMDKQAYEYESSSDSTGGRHKEARVSTTNLIYEEQKSEIGLVRRL
jgi:hypothetical protein